MSILEELGLPSLPEPLPRPVIDNHTHLGTTREYSRLGEVDSVDLAASVGVIGVVDVGCDLASSREAVAWAESDPRIVASIAMHPNDAARLVAREGEAALTAELAGIRELARSPRVRAIGETGIDHYRTRDEAGQRVQEASFREHISWAKELGLTLVVHDRDAHADILRVLDDEGAPKRVVMHCFSGDAAFARECVERGFWLSFPGVVTFGSAGPLREAARVTPLDRLLVETDAPYLTPRPERGRPNAPYLVPHTVRFLADLLGQDLAGFCDRILANTFAAYGGAWGADHA